jgi:hypothetical protein
LNKVSFFFSGWILKDLTGILWNFVTRKRFWILARSLSGCKNFIFSIINLFLFPDTKAGVVVTGKMGIFG